MAQETPAAAAAAKRYTHSNVADAVCDVLLGTSSGDRAASCEDASRLPITLEALRRGREQPASQPYQQHEEEHEEEEDEEAAEEEVTALLIPGFLSPAECKAIIDLCVSSEYRDPSDAYPPSYRNNERQVWHSDRLAAVLSDRLRACPALPQKLTWRTDRGNPHRTAVADKVKADGVDHAGGGEKEEWAFLSVNPRFRACRYTPGQFFGPHQDGSYSPTPDVRTRLTLMIYLNGADGSFAGGGTDFLTDRLGSDVLHTVTPSTGAAVVFEHSLWHRGEEVSAGVKYILRTDLLFRKATLASPGSALIGQDGDASTRPRTELGRHDGYVWAVDSSSHIGPRRIVASASRDKTVRLWDVKLDTDRCIAVLRGGHTASVLCVKFVPDSSARFLVTGGRDRKLVFWDTVQQQALQEIDDAHAGNVLALAMWSSDLGVLLSAGADGMVKVWRQEPLHGDWAMALDVQMSESWIWALDTAPFPSPTVAGDAGSEQRLVLAACEDGSAQVWRLSLGEERGGSSMMTEFAEKVAPGRGPISAAIFLGSPTTTLTSSTLEFALGMPGEVGIFSLDLSASMTGVTHLHALVLEHQTLVRSLCVLPGGRIAAGGEDDTISIFCWQPKSAENGQSRGRKIAMANFVHSLTVTANDAGLPLLVAGCYDGAVVSLDPSMI